MELTSKQIAALTKKRWVLLIICCLINLCVGSMYAWSVLAGPMAQELNVANLSIVFSVANSVGFISMIIGGLVADRKGPRWVMFLGGLMLRHRDVRLRLRPERISFGDLLRRRPGSGLELCLRLHHQHLH